MNTVERIASAAGLTILVVVAALLVGNVITWHAETAMEWDAQPAAAAGYQGAILVLTIAFALLAIRSK